MRKTWTAFVLIALGASWTSTEADVITVAQDGSGDFTTINAALIHAATWAHEEVQVKPGVYAEIGGVAFSFSIPAAIRLTSTDGPEVTVLQSLGYQGVLGYHESLSPIDDGFISGFTIRNGSGQYGGGLLVAGHTVRIENCIFNDNGAAGGGAVAAIQGAQLTFVDCEFIDNIGGIGACLYSPGSSTISLEGCLVCDSGGDSAFAGNVSHDNMCMIWDDCDDCNANGEPDDEDYLNGLLTDLDGNGLWDYCEGDCNNNDVADPLECAVGYSPDVNGNWIPDDCESDCDGDGLPDDYEMDIGTDQDCDGNGVADACDIAEGLMEDCDGDGMPDDCDGDWQDCNDNGIHDLCEMTDGGDCNENEIPDVCEIADGTMDDLNDNEVDDECECLADIDESGWVYYDEIVFWLQWHGQDGTPADVDFSGHVDIRDLIYILSHWGACPN